MLKKVQPKVWWMAIAVLVILLISWGLVRKNKADSPDVAVSGKSVKNLDPVPVSNPDAETEEKIAKIQDIFRRKRNAGFNGNVLIVQKGKILYQNSFGFAHMKAKDTLTADSRFQLASLSKPFTAVAVLKLIQEGRVALDDSVQRFFPDFPYHGVKVDMLLSHRSGLPNYIYSFDDSVRHGRKYPDNLDIMDWYAKVVPTPTPYNRPGRSFNYCNTNYCVLAAIVEKVTGDSFGKYLNSQIFTPLGMQNTYLVTDTTIAATKNRTDGHQYGRRLDKDYYDDVVGDKGLYSTTLDIYRFYNGLTKGLILEKKMLDEAFKPRSFERDGIRNYGYGFRMHIKEDHTPRFIYHGGWWKGYNTMLWVCPEDDAVIIVLGNTYNRSTYDLRELLEVVHGSVKIDNIEKDI
ncbi:CubicO group peptidase (beta-lactamase class C family) [Dyadobacter sp. BE34]|uniref:CubicO group peptidase (Beta-lactamase class C family) n=1 Tax=Dyadobacter fermentans TaxID=94254 RepID=A0ABU1QPU0_9BACT|nr:MULTISPECIES: serine hydrolase domain-containing protein [Dyadobacter]MDR6803166.1 CubicO group peptidase (beta-lactamase class C family) [Dyadobacter fermentans]MDR7040907.1 CubicO group peptidase (beta-lactamase class C family) [Dyadobacter sp. BE242]MDR7195310.1 CubicO group peptidase (beta-lactamase class C family) [Dyadobacter sp. BE34]MDR7214144.1 CubicO group peptidase (beta-lactamase class C family) [Dyadobacter sp. BE31]MDR7260717.1 CubicO group peptidase (beta-lactamase class C fa